MFVRVNREKPVQKPITHVNTYELTRAVRIRYTDGVVKYVAHYDFVTCINRPHQEKYGDEIPGYTPGYEGRVRGTFNVAGFVAVASEPELDWLRERLDGLPPKPAEEIPAIASEPIAACG